MRRGGATGAPPASRSGHHHRSQPAPPPPMLRNGGSGAGRSLCPSQFRARSQPHRTRPGARPPQAPPPPCASQRVVAGPAAHDQGFNQHTAGATTIRPRNSNPHWRSTAPPLRAVEHASPIRTSAPHPARQAPPNPGLSRRLLPLAPHRTPHRFATTNAPLETNAASNSNAPRPLRSGAFTMQ